MSGVMAEVKKSPKNGPRPPSQKPADRSHQVKSTATDKVTREATRRLQVSKAPVYYFVFLQAVNLFSYHLYSPTPPGLEQPWTYSTTIVANLRVLDHFAKGTSIPFIPQTLEMGLIKIDKFVLQLSDGLGYKEYHVFKQDASALAAHVTASATSSDVDVDVTSDVLDGVSVRIYRSNDRKRQQGALVFIHDGGFIQGATEAYDGLLRRLTVEAGVTIVGVDYRLAPQHPSPAAMEDCMRAARYVFLEASKLDVDPRRVGVVGDGAGGNLALSLAINFRDIANAPKFAYAALLNPWLQAVDLNTPGMQQNERFSPPDLTRRGLAMSALHYINASLQHTDTLTANQHVRPVSAAHYGRHIRPSTLPPELLHDEYVPTLVTEATDDAPEDQDNRDELLTIEAAILDPLNFPLMADTLKALPPMLVTTAGFSTVRDDGFWLVNRLKKDEVPVKHYHDPLGWHGLAAAVGALVEFEAAQRLYTELLGFIRIVN